MDAQHRDDYDDEYDTLGESGAETEDALDGELEDPDDGDDEFDADEDEDADLDDDDDLDDDVDVPDPDAVTDEDVLSDILAAPEELQPESQGEDPVSAELGEEGQGDLAPEDEV